MAPAALNCQRQAQSAGGIDHAGRMSNIFARVSYLGQTRPGSGQCVAAAGKPARQLPAQLLQQSYCAHWPGHGAQGPRLPWQP